MSITTQIKNFWIDFFITYHNRLIKNNKSETALTNLVHLAFVQAVNFDIFAILIIAIFFPSYKLSFILLFVPFVLMASVNIYYFYFKLSREEKNTLLNRIPKYRVIVYDIYNVLSTILFLLSLYFASIRR